MSRRPQKLAEKYASAMEACLSGGGEDALRQAYELGRHALVDGCGVLDISEIYHKSLSDLLRQAGTAEESRLKMNAAAGFFAESLSPYEMAQRGFQESYASLRQLNESLSQRAKELKQANQLLEKKVKELERAHVEIRGLNSEMERRALELETSNRELEAFSYSVSHDLRAPLRSIDGFSQALIEDYDARLDEIGKDYLRRVRSAAQRMGHLIDAMLELSQLSRAEIRERKVDISSLAESIVCELRDQQPDRDIEIVIQHQMSARGDHRLLRLVIQNLLGNAWKFTSKTSHPRIEVGSRVADGRQIFYVKDNGAGFDTTYATKLFGPFQRLHDSKEYPGTGIGLATVKRIVRRHGGEVWAESQPESGATFYFTLG